jgi:hypothetical protein
MRNFLILFFAFALFFSACNNTTSTDETIVELNDDYEYFGAEISSEGAISGEEFLATFTDGDSIFVKIAGEISTVCQKKGCWMNMQLTEDKNLFVRFKDYEFFVPLNCAGRNAVIEGCAYKEEISVDELKHFAFDEGLSVEEINDITEPKITYSFMADGVILM